MIGLTASRLSRMLLKHRRVGLLASTAVKSLGLYEHAFDPLGITVAYPRDQAQVMCLIKAVKRGETGADQRRELLAIAEELQDAEVLIIACTELSVLADGLDSAKAVLDSLDVLVEEVVAWGLGSRTAKRTRKEFHTSHSIGDRG